MSKAFATAFKITGDIANYNLYARQATRPRVVELYGDRDNICNSGPDDGRFARIHLPSFAAALATARVQWSTIFTNRTSGEYEHRLYAKNSIKLVACGENCDQQMIDASMARIARGGIDHLILLTGDHFACEIVRFAIAHGVTTEVWARSGKISRALAATVRKLKIIDDFMVVTPHPGAQAEIPIAA